MYSHQLGKRGGGNPSLPSSLHFMQDFMEEQGLVNLGFQGETLTLSNNRSDFNLVQQSRNAIEFLKTDSGAWLSSRLEIDNHIVDFSDLNINV